ncbi:MAG TPA: AGE family epimerase/isomerase [Spirochaetia bacterium]|nr:AGE family epimerase/isomerase [Spirochaetia bacterium]
MTNAELTQFKTRYVKNLEESVIPFWEKYSIDREAGGYLTCLERDGRLFDADKFTWLGARELWMWSKLYTSYRREPRWVDLAQTGADFLKRYGRDPRGDWYFALDRQGRPLVEAYNIFSDCFAAVAFAEYHRATGDRESLEIALATYRRIQERKSNPKGRFTKQIGSTRSLKAMALPMIQIWMAEEMGDLLEPGLREAVVRENIDQVTSLHIDRERRAVFERVAADGSHPFCMEGRLLTPGHALEVLWFLLRTVSRRSRSAGLAAGKAGAANTTGAAEGGAAAADDAALIELLTEAVLFTAERGWDHEQGGFFYYMDYEGLPPDKLEWDMKLWWVHAEALCAFLISYQLTGRSEFLEWFRRTDDYVFSHFDDPEYGEWFGYLHRGGDAALTLKGGKWKGFFHVPRALLTCIGVFDELAAAAGGPPPEHSQHDGAKERHHG